MRDQGDEFWAGFLMGATAVIVLLAVLLAMGCSSTAPLAPKPAAWCSLAEGEDGFCDGGSAVPLHCFELSPGRCLLPVALVGSRTAGAGVALSLVDGERYTVGVGAGVAAPWEIETGIQADRAALVLGCTVGLNSPGSTSAAGEQGKEGETQ